MFVTVRVSVHETERAVTFFSVTVPVAFVPMAWSATAWDGVSTVSGGSIGENVELQVRPGAVLDLGGGTLVVDWARSVQDRSNIVNGTLVVRKGWRRPFSPGFVLIVK